MKPRYVLLFLIAFQALLFYNFYSREIAWYPPSNFDQTYYLPTAYRIQEQFRAIGFPELVRSIGSRQYTGVALPIEGAVSGLVLGGTRLPQLFINFLLFCALQVFAFYTARAVWDSRAYGYMLVGLILCQNTPWYWVGGMFDFRMDFSAYCLYGIWTCAAIRSKLFLDRRWAIGVGLLGAFLVLHRFLTLVYLVGVSAGFAGICIALGLLWRADQDFAARMWTRLKNLVLSFGIMVAIVTPFFIRSWALIYEYYGIQHAVGTEKYAHAHDMGIENLSQQLLFYPKSLLQDHWGLIFFCAAAIAIMSGLIASFLDRRKNSGKKTSSRHDETFLLQTIFLLGATLGPLVVLNADADKNPCVGGIVGVSVALLVVVLAARAAPILRELEPSRIRKFLIVCSFVIFGLGIANVFQRLNRHLPEYTQRRELERLVELDKWLVNYASDHNWSRPAISFDVESPWLLAGGITSTGFEHTGEFIDFHAMLSDGVLGVEWPEAVALLEKSDFVILTTGLKAADAGEGLSVYASTASFKQFPAVQLRHFPFYDHIDKYRDDLKAWVDKNMVLAQTVPFENFTANVYVRPTATPSGLSVGNQ
jgi:hypothetical protein